MADYTKQSPAGAAISQYRKDVATMGEDAAHRKLMADVEQTQAAARAGSAKATALLEANDPGSTTHSDGKSLVDSRISNKHQSPF